MRNKRHVAIEALETRKLLSSATFYTSGSARGQLIVVGNETTPNDIVISLVKTDSGLRYQVVHNGHTQTFKRAGVKQIYLFGGDANDSIVVDESARKFNFPVSIFGRAGDDTLTGGSGRDSIVGEDGDDLIQGARGNDRLAGELGNDRIYGGYVTPITNDGNDTLWGENGNDPIGRDKNAPGGDDTLVGGSGFDLMYGGPGNDTMYGGLPNDPKNHFRDASDDMFGQGGNDYLNAGSGGLNRLHGMDNTDTVIGGPHNDTLYGGAGVDNVLQGGGGQTLGEVDGEWQFLSNFLFKISPKSPKDPGPRANA